MARADRPTTESCWASIKLGPSTWPRRTPRWPRPASTTGRIWCRRSSTPTARCFSTPATRTRDGEQRIDKGVADNVTAAMQPIAGVFAWPQLGRRPAVGGQDRHGAVGRHPTANKDAWMVGYTPSLSTAVWVGTVPGQRAAGNRLGRRGLRLGPAVGHLEVDDGRRAEGHLQRDLPQADRDRWLRGCAGRAAPAAPAAVGDRHPAHHRSGAGHHHPGRSAHDDHRAPPPPAGPSRASRRAARRPHPPFPQPPP